MNKSILYFIPLLSFAFLSAMELPKAPGPRVPLWQAAANNDLPMVQWYLDNKNLLDININGTNPGGDTPLAIAASNGNEQIVNLLLAAGAKPNAQNVVGASALHQAAGKGNIEIVQQLLCNGAHINLRMNDKRTPLMMAVMNEKKEIVKLLIDSGANVDAIDDLGKSALDWARMIGNQDLIQLLSGDTQKWFQNFKIKEEQNAEKKIICEKKLPGIAEEMPIRSRPKMPLIEAVLKDDVETVKWYIANRGLPGIDINDGGPGGGSAVMAAAEPGHEQIFSLLLAAGADPNIRDLNGRTALHYALFQGRSSVAKALIEAGADVNAKDYRKETPLMAAAGKGNSELVTLLIELGADLDAVDNWGWNAVEHALQHRKPEIAKIITKVLRRESSSSSSPENNSSESDEGNVGSILDAAVEGDIELVLWHLQQGESVDEENQDGQTPLMLAATEGHDGVLLILLEQGANINAIDDQGNSALMLALKEHEYKCAKLLIEAGANVKIINNVGETAWWLASFSRIAGLLDLLKAAGANPHESSWAIADVQEQERMRQKLAEVKKGWAIKRGTYLPDIDQWEAAESGDLDAINWYISHGIDLNEADEDGETPLMLAIKNGYEKIVQALIAHGVKIDAIDQNGNTLLMQALLVADRTSDRWSGPIISFGDEEIEKKEELPAEGTQSVIARLLIQAGADWQIKNNLNQDALLISVRQGRPEIVQELISLGADPNAKTEGDYDYTMLMVAAYLHRQDVIAALVAAGANVNATDDDGVTALMISASRCDDRGIKRLLDLGAHVQARDILGRTALDYARRTNCEEAITILENAEKIEPLVTTPLIMAVNRGEINKVKKILEHQVDVNEQDELGDTALGSAVRIGSMRFVELLLDHGASIDTTNNSGMTPLHQAVMGGFIDIARLFLKLGADVNARDAYDNRIRGRTPLLWVGRLTSGAVQKISRHMNSERAVELLELLLQHGADPEALDHEGMNALDWAEVTPGQEALVAILAPVTHERHNTPLKQEKLRKMHGSKDKAPKAKPKKVVKANPKQAKAPAQPKAPAKAAPKQAKQPKAALANPKKVAPKKQIANPKKVPVNPVKAAVKVAAPKPAKNKSKKKKDEKNNNNNNNNNNNVDAELRYSLLSGFQFVA